LVLKYVSPKGTEIHFGGVEIIENVLHTVNEGRAYTVTNYYTIISC